MALLATLNGYFSNFQICEFALVFLGRGGPSVTRTKRELFFFEKSSLTLPATLNGYFSNLAEGAAGAAGAAYAMAPLAPQAPQVPQAPAAGAAGAA